MSIPSAGYLSEHAYGKIRVKVMKINRLPNGVHVPHEMEVQTMLWGDFAESWTTGSNEKIIATETQKNTVYKLAQDSDLDSPEEFGKMICAHFLKHYHWVTKAQATITEDLWGRVVMNGKPHKHAFTKSTSELRYAQVTQERNQRPAIIGGMQGLIVLKTTQSSFEKFVGCPGAYVEKDPWTSLKETKDRLFSTSVDSYWTYASDNVPFNECYDKIKNGFIEQFAGPPDTGVPSPSAQITQHNMCLAGIDACKPHVLDIKIATPNLHYMPLNHLNIPKYLHAEKNDVFIPWKGPSGYITSKASLRAKL